MSALVLVDGCVAVINAEGKLNGMQPNRRNGDDIICGPFFICGDSPDGDFISLTEQQIEKYQKKYTNEMVFSVPIRPEPHKNHPKKEKHENER